MPVHHRTPEPAVGCNPGGTGYLAPSTTQGLVCALARPLSRDEVAPSAPRRGLSEERHHQSERTHRLGCPGPTDPARSVSFADAYRGTWLVGMYYYMVRRVKLPGALFSPTRTHGYSERESAPGSSPDSSQPFSINRVTARRYGWDHDPKLIRDAAGPTAALSDMIFWRARIQNLKRHDGSLSLPPFRVIPPWGEVAGYPRSRTELQHTP